MWRAKLPEPDQVARLQSVRERFDLYPLAIHANYLINLASDDPAIRPRSIAAFRGELDRAATIWAEYLVLHPGSYRGRSPEEGIASIAAGLRDATKGFRNRRLQILIENTAGAGCHLGSTFEELQAIRLQASLPIGFCLDTCHLLAAGFDISTQPGLRRALRQADELLDLDNVHLIHANDSKTPLGSRVDRHENIGEGHIGKEGFRRMLRHPKLRMKPFILETPVDTEGDDRRNLDTLKLLARP
jgi:deoxyribonuclease-4